MPQNQHTSRVYESELRTLRERLLLMGGMVEDMVTKSMRALRTRDSALARSTMKMDRRINRLECDIDELCMRILAMRQPVASDLRFVTTALKIVTDLERIGDLAANICERVAELNTQPAGPSDLDLGELADQATLVVHEALEALVHRDVERAIELLDRDEIIDEQYTRIFERLLALMAQDSTAIYRATRIQSIAKYFERIGDHATNIAENVVFLVKGKDIRHRHRWNEGEAENDSEVDPK
ncbi:MAG TPA: phosphate signaling complex protein PhoU [Polyangium sp.]|nr:phosphate signaling complex protein PhoU [Polyangium sp.]